MINTKHLLKVGAAWISIVYIICFAGVLFVPQVRPGFMTYGLHMMGYMGSDYVNLTTFISGLVIWNVLTFLGIWLFTVLFNGIKK